ncbi:MAG: hypothetical protein QHH80_14360 [Anaerolineae bacterium]|nr:hypothetical protein [Anaerolineae bacterium]
MKCSRREFLEGLGIVLASVVLSGCKPPAQKKDDWDRVRDAWYGLDQLAQDAKDMERGQKTLDRLIADHLAALDSLVQSGQVSAAQADDIHVAFQAAARHVWRANAPMTCYVPAPYPQYRIMGASDLAQQADILAEMAARSAIDPATVAQARASIQRDMAVLLLSDDDEKALIEALRQTVGEGGSYPSLEELQLTVSPEAVGAAALLVDILLGKK